MSPCSIHLSFMSYLPLRIHRCAACPWQLVRAFSEDGITSESEALRRTVARVGKMDAKKHLDTQLNQLMSANILQCMCAPPLPSCIPTPHSCRHCRVAQCRTGMSVECTAHAAHLGRRSAQRICSSLPAPNRSSLLRKQSELGKMDASRFCGQVACCCRRPEEPRTQYTSTGLKSL